MAQYHQYIDGNVAVELGAEELEREELLQEPVRRLTVLPGSRPQHTVQQGQSALPAWAITATKSVAVAAAVMVAVALVRILLISAAFTFASQNASLTTRLEEARSMGSELEVQQSVYSNKDRIVSLATDVYGMVPAEGMTVIDLSGTAVAAVATASGDLQVL